jgi:hypothetical protein
VRLSRNASALAALLVVNVALVYLLTPIGFESRPPSALKIVGYVAIATIFVGLPARHCEGLGATDWPLLARGCQIGSAEPSTLLCARAATKRKSESRLR